MARQSIVYLLSSNLAHDGIRRKVDGQCAALSTRFRCRLVRMHFGPESGCFAKVLATCRFHVSAFWSSIWASRVYMRYNAKLPLLLIWLGLLSWLKPIDVEHNALLDDELKFLGRFNELKLHRFLMGVLRFTRIRHIGNTPEMTSYLQSQYHVMKRRSVYAQNCISPVSYTEVSDPDLQQKVRDFVKAFRSSAIFVGSGCEWHGVDVLLQDLSKYSDIGLVLVGDYNVDVSTNSQVLLLGSLAHQQLWDVMQVVNFGIGPYRWDKIGVSQGSPLKTRDYLSAGLPVLAVYKDMATDIDSLNPHIVTGSDESAWKKVSNLPRHNHQGDLSWLEWMKALGF